MMDHRDWVEDEFRPGVETLTAGRIDDDDDWDDEDDEDWDDWDDEEDEDDWDDEEDDEEWDELLDVLPSWV